MTISGCRFNGLGPPRNDKGKVGREGVEPSRCYQRQILSLLRLPIPPSPRQWVFYYKLLVCD